MTTPRPTRAAFPARKEHGETAAIPGGEEEPLWGPIAERLGRARYYWLVTIGLRGAPHVVPVDAVWSDNRLYFASHSKTVTAKNLLRDPRVVAHLEDARAVAIIEGLAERCEAPRLPNAIPELYAERFGLRLNPSDPEMPFFVVRPTVVWTWNASDLRRTSIRWVFE